jgi:hypothetical protein
VLLAVPTTISMSQKSRKDRQKEGCHEARSHIMLAVVLIREGAWPADAPRDWPRKDQPCVETVKSCTISRLRSGFLIKGSVEMAKGRTFGGAIATVVEEVMQLIGVLQ